MSKVDMAARPSGGVSTPITWKELARIDSGDHFTVLTLPQRMRQGRTDPWAAYCTTVQRITSDAGKRLAAVR